MMPTAGAFESTIGLFYKYCRDILERNDVPYDADLLGEVFERLRQLDFLLEIIKPLQWEVSAIDRRFDEALARYQRDHPTATEASVEHDVGFPNAELDRKHELLFQMYLYTEAFYFFADRLRVLLRCDDLGLSVFREFEVKGVRDVRNKLIQHPERRDSRVFLRSWYVHPEAGPQIKPARYESRAEVFDDPGLLVNVEEMKAKIESILIREISKGAS